MKEGIVHTFIDPQLHPTNAIDLGHFVSEALGLIQFRGLLWRQRDSGASGGQEGDQHEGATTDEQGQQEAAMAHAEMVGQTSLRSQRRPSMLPFPTTCG